MRDRCPIKRNIRRFGGQEAAREFSATFVFPMMKIVLANFRTERILLRSNWNHFANSSVEVIARIFYLFLHWIWNFNHLWCTRMIFFFYNLPYLFVLSLQELYGIFR